MSLPNTGIHGLRKGCYASVMAIYDSVEKIVSLYPEQWLWFHKRWKRHHPELYPEDIARRQRQREKRKARGPKKR
ncbi:MAG: hypothetical protein JRE64_01380 [Deltaproteobacteria bacterium]|nr:hypothetical protein [Deltaproteobacteria bacterium]